MKINAYYHLFETAHSGLLDEPVNLVPESWNRFTVTDGNWMTSATLEALRYRDLFLSQQIEIVDNDKKNHYVAGNSIVIDNDTYTINFIPTQYNYNFKSGLNFNEDYRYISISLPRTFDTLDNRPEEYKINKIQLSSDGLFYSITKGNNTESTIEKETHNLPANSAGIIGDVTTFPQNANIVYISDANMNVFDEYYEYQSKQYQIDSWSADTVEYQENGRCLSGWNEFINSSYNNTSYTSANIFNPNDITQFNAVTGENPTLEGGLNYICGNVNMVPSGVLFIYNNSSYYYKDINGIVHTNESNPLYAYSAYRNENDEIVSSRIYFYQGKNKLF